jgi:hypothetical protein
MMPLLNGSAKAPSALPLPGSSAWSSGCHEKLDLHLANSLKL